MLSEFIMMDIKELKVLNFEDKFGKFRMKIDEFDMNV